MERKFTTRGHCDFRSVSEWVAVNAGANGREGDTLTAMFTSQSQCGTICASKQFGFTPLPTLPDWTDCVDDVSCSKLKSGCDAGLARWATAESAHSSLEFGARRAVDGAVNAATGNERVVRGVNNGIDLHPSNVCLESVEIHGLRSCDLTPIRLQNKMKGCELRCLCRIYFADADAIGPDGTSSYRITHHYSDGR
jgi:hypothetical protein